MKRATVAAVFCHDWLLHWLPSALEFREREREREKAGEIRREREREIQQERQIERERGPLKLKRATVSQLFWCWRSVQ